MNVGSRGYVWNVLGAAVLAALAAAGSVRAADGSDAASPGRIHYLRHCAECHGMDALGDGPTVSVLTRKPASLRGADLPGPEGDEEIVRFVEDGRRLRLELRPDALKKHAAETEELFRFLRHLPNMDRERVEIGESIYLERCAICHDAYGHAAEPLPEGVRRPRDLSDPEFQRLSEQELLVVVKHGRHGMPALVPRVTDEDARRLVPYVRLFSPGFELYDRLCLACHGPYGEGGKGLFADASGPEIPFDRKYFKRRDREAVRAGIWHMLREENVWMPHFAGILRESEVKAIIGWLRSLPEDRKKR